MIMGADGLPSPGDDTEGAIGARAEGAREVGPGDDWMGIISAEETGVVLGEEGEAGP